MFPKIRLYTAKIFVDTLAEDLNNITHSSSYWKLQITKAHGYTPQDRVMNTFENHFLMGQKYFGRMGT